MFEPFVLRLFDKRESLDLPADLLGRNLGVYQAVLDEWDNSDQLQATLEAICDYHCKNMKKKCEWYPEVERPPFDIVPFEVIAIFSVRDLLGLSTPNIRHPLMSSVLSQNQPAPDPFTDDLLERVERAYQRLLS